MSDWRVRTAQVLRRAAHQRQRGSVTHLLGVVWLAACALLLCAAAAADDDDDNDAFAR